MGNLKLCFFVSKFSFFSPYRIILQVKIFIS